MFCETSKSLEYMALISFESMGCSRFHPFIIIYITEFVSLGTYLNIHTICVYLWHTMNKSSNNDENPPRDNRSYSILNFKPIIYSSWNRILSLSLTCTYGAITNEKHPM